MRTLALLTVALVACGGSGADDTEIVIESVTPAFGPLSGGTRVVITGSGFLRAGATPNRVLFGGRESPQAGAVDDFTLEAIVPEGVAAGDAPITVFNRNGNVMAEGLFKYSTEPTVGSLSPTRVLFSSTDTTVTITGSGFMDENAGRPMVLIDGEPALDVQVVSDTQITFTAKPGPILVTPEVHVINARGTAVVEEGFKYVPSLSPGLWVFPKNSTTTFALFYDPVAKTTISIPKKDTTTTQQGYRATFLDANGDIWVYGRDSRFGKLDFANQVVIDAQQMNNPRPNSLVRVGNTVYGTTRTSASFGTFNPAQRTFTPITPMAGQNQGLIVDGANMYALLSRQISTIDPVTGARGTPVSLTPANIEVSEARAIGGKIYATAGNQGNVNQIITIDPATGATTVEQTLNGFTLSALEIFQP